VIFTETKLAGAFIVDLERREDSRGFFARMFCQHEFADHGLEPFIAQANIARSTIRGTVRGMHFQYPPAAETKYVTCPRGAVRDVIVDLRPESPTYLEHISIELTEDNHRAVYIPRRFAHGYQTLADETVTIYMVGEFYTPGSEGGLAYDDPALAIDWPLGVAVISDKDSAWPPLAEVGTEVARRMRTESPP
jgi:dTDP-4-dehydrorhamnose 3,5-epimerase